MTEPSTPTTTAVDLEVHLDLAQAAARLERRFEGTFSPETVRRYVVEAHERMSGSTVHRWLPLLAERIAADQLRALRKLQLPELAHKPHVVFLCVHNAGRSQMAAGWLRHLAGDVAEVFSGGSDPASTVNRAAVAAMAEAGVDIATELPQPWTDEVIRAADVVITMGCGDACPIVPGVRYEDWEVTDPNGLDLDAVRPIRDDIRDRVRTLMGSLAIPERT